MRFLLIIPHIAVYIAILAWVITFVAMLFQAWKLLSFLRAPKDFARDASRQMRNFEWHAASRLHTPSLGHFECGRK
jgi:hypothetical protein